MIPGGRAEVTCAVAANARYGKQHARQMEDIRCCLLPIYPVFNGHLDQEDVRRPWDMNLVLKKSFSRIER